MQDNNRKLEFLKKLTLKEILYSAISFLFAIAVVLAFFFSVRFIVANVNKTFYVPTESEVAGQITTFDKANYIMVASKLGISIVGTRPGVVKQEQPEMPQVEAPVAATTMPEIVIDKKSLKIAIYNTTQTPGVAAKLKAIFVGGGFDVAETGNKTPALATTTLKLKANILNHSLAEEIKTLVGSSYQVVSEAAADDATFDVEIAIGDK